MVLNAEEKYAYDASLSSFLTLKIWNDLGIDVTHFADFMTFPGGYYGEPEPDIFMEGLQQIFPDSRCLDYQELEQIKEIASDIHLESIPETMIILMNDKIRKLVEIGETEKLLGVIPKQHGELCEFDLTFHAKYGIVISLHFGGLMFEIAMSVSEISREIDSLYNQSKENSNGFYRKAV